MPKAHATIHVPVALCNRIRRAIRDGRSTALDVSEFLRTWVGISILGIQGRFEHPTPFDWDTYHARMRFVSRNSKLQRQARQQQWWTHRLGAGASSTSGPLAPYEDHTMPLNVVEAIDTMLHQVRVLCPSRAAFIRQSAEYGLAVCSRRGTPAPHPDWRQA